MHYSQNAKIAQTAKSQITALMHLKNTKT